MRIDDEGHGFAGTIYHAQTRQAVDYETDKLKWFHNRNLIKTNEPPQGAQPVLDYIFHVAVDKGRGAFTKRDENGDPIKLSSGKNATEVRDIEHEDVAFVASAAWLSRLVKANRLNTGHQARLRRLTPARDENGDRMTDVHAELDITGKVSDPKPFDPDRAPRDTRHVRHRRRTGTGPGSGSTTVLS